MDEDAVVYTHDENGTDVLIGVPGRDLTQSDLDRMEPWSASEFAAYLANGGKDWQLVDSSKTAKKADKKESA